MPYAAAYIAAAACLLASCAQLPKVDAEAAKNEAPKKAAAAPAFPIAAAAFAATAAVAASAPPPNVLTPPTPPTPPGGPPPFATVIKDARRIDGPLTLWQKEDKVWIELLPAQFGQPFLLSPKIKSGISEAWVLGGLMAFQINGAGGPQVVEFQRVHNQVRLAARNTDVTAAAGTPEARALPTPTRKACSAPRRWPASRTPTARAC